MGWVALCSSTLHSKATTSWRSFLVWKFWQALACSNMHTHTHTHWHQCTHSHSHRNSVKTSIKTVKFPQPNQVLMVNPLPPQRRYRWRRGKSGASRYVSIHGGTRPLQKQTVEVGEALCTWRVLLTGYCDGHTVSRMAAYKWTACKHLLSKHLRQAHF